MARDYNYERSRYSRGYRAESYAGHGPRGYRRSDERIREDVNRHRRVGPRRD